MLNEDDREDFCNLNLVSNSKLWSDYVEVIDPRKPLLYPGVKRRVEGLLIAQGQETRG